MKDENIIVFMYDDIANNTMNPRPGVIINSPNGSDVYAGVPKVCCLRTIKIEYGKKEPQNAFSTRDLPY